MKHAFLAAAAVVFAAAPALAQAPAAAQPAGCRMGLVAELPVTFRNNRPTVPVEIDGHPVTALLDTGAGTTVIFTDAAQRLGISTRADPRYRSFGADGEGKVSFAHVSLGLMGAKGPARDLMVTGKSGDVDMLIGEDILSQTALEMDLGHGKMRLLRPVNCRDEDMAYWAQSYSEAQITEQGGRYIRLDVMLNGARVHAMLDSGASSSVAVEGAAFRAGATLPPLTGKATSRGVNGVAFETRRGQLSSVQIGDEKIGATTMRFGPLFRHEEAAETGSRIGADESAEMLLGADFLRSHHVLIDRGRGKMFFTYNGGPVFLPEQPTTPPNTGIRR